MDFDESAITTSSRLSIENIIGVLAEKIALQRIVDHLAQTRDTKNIIRPAADVCDDWYKACSLFALIVFENPSISFAQMETNWYDTFEKIWIKEIKEAKAYLIWDTQRSGTQEEHYFKACDYIRERLFSVGRSDLSWFEKIRKYLIDKYLKQYEGAHVLDESKSDGLIMRKAERIYNVTENQNGLENWQRAKFYVKLFYNSIIPAVVDNDRNSTINVLRAFQASHTPKAKYLIINAFEASIAVHFLNKELVRELANNAAQTNIGIYPTSECIPMPDNVKAHLEFDSNQNVMILYGVMCEDDRDKLLLVAQSEAQKTCIESLYQQSILNPVNDIL